MNEEHPLTPEGHPVTHAALILGISAYELFYAVFMWQGGRLGYALLAVLGLVCSLIAAYLVGTRKVAMLTVSRLAPPITILWMFPALLEALQHDGPIEPHTYMSYLILVVFSFAILRLGVAMALSGGTFLALLLVTLTRQHYQVTQIADVAFISMLVGLLTVFGRQTAEQRQKTLDLAHLASRDSLTGLLNRRAVEEVLREWMTPTHKPPGVALVLLDLDYFKSLNDTYGHREGDEALRAVARAMEGQCRSGDLLCRWGGEEFLLVLKGVNPPVALEVARRVQRQVSDLTLNIPRRLTLSGGIAMLDEAYSLPELLALADRRLYAAKNAGRNTIYVEGPRFASGTEPHPDHP